jgi:putrescine transport system substrate-binding protein
VADVFASDAPSDKAHIAPLAAAVIMGAVLVIAGCSRKTDDATADAGDNVVNVYNWTDYIDPAVLEKFTAETGIRVNYDVYDSNELLESKLLTGHTGYDVVVPTGPFAERQIKAGVFLELDRSQIPNWSNLDPDIMQRLALHDPGNAHAINYMWGTDGIGYNEDQVRSRMPDAPVDSWSLVFDPKIAARFDDCGIALVDSPSDIVAAVLAYLGRDPNSESEQDLALAEATLMAIRPYIRAISTASYIDGLANGELCIAVGWAGDMLQARDRAAEAGKAQVIKYSIPREGTIIWFDAIAIPLDAPHPGNAHAFLNFLQRPDVAAANTNFLHYANGNSASLPLVTEQIRNDPAVYPPAEIRATLFPSLARTEEYSRLLNRSWTRFVTAGSDAVPAAGEPGP